MKIFLTRILTVILLLIGVQRASAQSVEAVLRALQERNVILETRASYYPPYATTVTPIQWGGDIDDYPEEETITNMQAALDALNLASQKYELLGPCDGPIINRASGESAVPGTGWRY